MEDIGKAKKNLPALPDAIIFYDLMHDCFDVQRVCKAWYAIINDGFSWLIPILGKTYP